MTTQYKAEFLRGTIHPNFSNGETDKVLISMMCTHPYSILVEISKYSRIRINSASLRAIPTAKIIEMVEANPFIPEFTKNQKGMAANEYLNEQGRFYAEADWEGALKDAIAHAKYLAELGVAKQDVNRLLAPFMWNTIIATAPLTDWLHLLNQRLHPDADKKFQRLAQEIRTSLNNAEFAENEQHLPFGTYEMVDFSQPLPENKYTHDAISVINNIAQIARVSYLNRGEFTFEQNLEFVNKLIANGHWSPFDHIAKFTKEKQYGIWSYWRSSRESIQEWRSYQDGGIIQQAKDNGITIDLV